MENGYVDSKAQGSRKSSKEFIETDKVPSMTFSAKLYGKMQVMEPRGDAICEGCLALLKARLLTAKKGKKQVTIEVLPTVINVRERKVSEPIFTHTVNDITYVWNDVTNTDICGLIAKQTIMGENAYAFFGYKLKNNSVKLIGALKRVFIEHFSTPVDLKAGTESQPSDTPEAAVANLIDLDEPCEVFPKRPSIELPRISAPQNTHELPRRSQNWARFDDGSDEDECGFEPIVSNDPWGSYQPQVSSSSAESENSTASEASLPLPSYNTPPPSFQPFYQPVSNSNAAWCDFSSNSPVFPNSSSWTSTPTTNHAIPSWLAYERSTIDWNGNLLSGIQQTGKLK